MSPKKIASTTQNTQSIFNTRKPLAAAIAAASFVVLSPNLHAACSTSITGFEDSCELQGQSVTITSSGVVSGSSSSSSNGIYETDGYTSGSIQNEGTIFGSSNGVFVCNSDLQGGIENNGTISAGRFGIEVVTDADISGGITNSGLVYGADAAVKVDSNSDIGGGLDNLAGGLVMGGNRGVSVGSDSDISGGIANRGTISGSSFGISLSGDADLSGGIDNRGVIASDGVGIGVTDGSTMIGDILNRVYGVISGRTGILVSDGSNIVGGIDNIGLISGADGIVVESSSDISGGIVNSGFISVSGAGVYVSTSSSISGGILNEGVIRGDSGIVNYGSITSIVSAFGGDIEAGIDNYGSIVANTSGEAIRVRDGGDISGGIYNAGTISNTGGTGQFAAIHVDSESTIQGDITNSGTIQGIAGGSLGGIAIGAISSSDISGHINNLSGGVIYGSDVAIGATSNGSFSGGIENAGILSGGSTAIYLDNGASISNSDGVGIQNSGLIQGNFGAIVLNDASLWNGLRNDADGVIVANGTAILLENGASLYGGIQNYGTIQADDGISVSSSNISGGIYNAGLIDSGQYGIYVNGEDGTTLVADGITNVNEISGGSYGIFIDSEAEVSGGIYNGAGALISGSSYGIRIDTSSTVTGSIENRGTITGGRIGLEVDSGSTVDQVVNYAGALISGSTGLYMGSSTDISGGVVNYGVISGSANGVRMSEGDANDISGGIDNYGVISGGSVGIELESDADISGGITNFAGGTISAGSGSVGTAIRLNGSSTISGGINNSGEIVAGYAGIGVFGSGADIGGSGIVNNSGALISGSSVGISVSNGSSSLGVSGGIDNSGVIRGNDWAGIFVSGAVGSDGIVNRANGTVSGSDYGISMSAGSVTEIVNSGTIRGGSNAGILLGNGSTVTGDIEITSADGAMVSGSNAGIELSGGSTVEGMIDNSGMIVGGDGIGIYAGSDVEGGIVNDGTIDASRYGVNICDSDVTGTLTNNGSILADRDGIYLHSGADLAGGIQNNSLISAESRGIRLSNGADISGGLVNAGTIVGSEEAIRITDAYLSGGITNSGTIQGLNGTAIDASNANGDIDITVQGLGQFIGDVDVNGGSFTVDDGAVFTTQGDFTGFDSFTVASSGYMAFGGSHDVGASDFTNNGVVEVTVGDVASLSGDYTQGANGTVVIEIQDTANYGQLDVNGTFDISANDLLTVQVVPNDAASYEVITSGDVFDDVVMAGGVNVTEAVVVEDNSALWRFEAEIDMADNIDLTALLQSPLDAIAYAGLEAEVPEFASDFFSTFDSLFSQFSPTVQAAYASIADEQDLIDAIIATQPVVAGQGIQTLNFSLNDITGVIGQRLDSAIPGLAAGDMALANQKVWFKPFGSYTSVGQHDGVPEYDASGGGLVVGYDADINETTRVGVALAGSSTSIEGADAMEGHDLDVTTVSLGLYAQFARENGAVIKVGVLGGSSDNDVERTQFIDTPFESVSSGTYDSSFGKLYVGLTGISKITERFSISPSVNLAYTYIEDDGYAEETEEGAPVNLVVDSNKTAGIQAGIDAKLAYSFNDDNTSRIVGRVGLGYDNLDDGVKTTAAFEGFLNNKFVIEGTEIDNIFFAGGLGYEMMVSDAVSLSVDYDLELREHVDHHMVSTKVTWSF